MRTIKFRAWHLLDRQMLDNTKLMFNFQGYELFCDTPDNPPIELMQFTGLHDKNGVEIFEDDILRDRFGNIFICEYGTPEAGFYLLSQSLFTIYFQNDSTDYIVIGNIYEHPHLIGED